MSLAFPDNDNRERRLIELQTDTNTALVEILRLEADIDQKIKSLDELAQALLKKFRPDLLPKVLNIELYKKAWLVSEIITPALLFKPAYNALSKAAAARLLSVAAEEGTEMAEAGAGASVDAVVQAAATELEIPLGAKLLGGLGGAILAVGVGFAIDAIEGRIARDKLQSDIHDSVPLRITQKVNEIQVTILQEMIGSLIDTYQILQDMGKSKEELDVAVQKHIDMFTPKYAAITPEIASAQLHTLDLARGSWINEDA